MTLEERITRLEDIEAIRYLQAKYQRCLDTRDFDGIAECFTDSVRSCYGNGSMSYNGKDAVVKFLCSVMTPDMPSTHLIHGGEIDISDSTHAAAKWYLEDYLLHEKFLAKIHGAAIYEVQYVKSGDTWQIDVIGYSRCYEYLQLRSILNIFTLKKKTYLEEWKHKNPEELGYYNRYFYENTVNKKKKRKK